MDIERLTRLAMDGDYDAADSLLREWQRLGMVEVSLSTYRAALGPFETIGRVRMGDRLGEAVAFHGYPGWPGVRMSTQTDGIMGILAASVLRSEWAQRTIALFAPPGPPLSES